MPKERSINPAQAQRKAEKAKAVKKGKAEAQSRRNEKLARRNPDRLQKELDDLKAVQSSGGSLTSHEKSLVESLEKDLKSVRKAREALGDAAPKFGSGRGHEEARGGFSGRGSRGGVTGALGKRRRAGDGGSSESDTPDEVKSIPMPKDTPPPIPKQVLDKWYQDRRDRMGHERDNSGRGTNANMTPLGTNDRRAGFTNGAVERQPSAGPPLEAKTVYEAKPVVRDLRKEAVSFLPSAVRAKLDKTKGVGGLVEPEEADRLEKEGYMATQNIRESNKKPEEKRNQSQRSVMIEDIEDEDG